MRTIACALGRSPVTISREFARNADGDGAYASPGVGAESVATDHLQWHCAHAVLLLRGVPLATVDVGLAQRRELLIHLRQRLNDPLAHRQNRVCGGQKFLQQRPLEGRFVVRVCSSHRVTTLVRLMTRLLASMDGC